MRLFDQRRALRVEDVCLQRFNGKHALQGLAVHRGFHLGWEAGVDEAEQLIQALLQEVAVLIDLAVALGLLADFPQTLERVARFVGLGLHGRVAQLRFGLDEEHEQDAIHIPQTLQGQVFCQRTTKNGHMLALLHVVDDLVTENLDALAQSVLQIPGHTRGVLVTVVVQHIQQAPAILRAEGIPMQQHSHGLQSAFLIAAKDVIQIEDQKALLIPLVPVDQCDLVFADQHDPAWALVQIIEQTSKQLFHRLTEQLFIFERRLLPGAQIGSHRHITQDIRDIGFIVVGDDQICAFHRCSEDCPEQRRTVFLADFQCHRHLADIWDLFQFRPCGKYVIAQRCQQIPGDLRNSLGIGSLAAPTLLPSSR